MVFLNNIIITNLYFHDKIDHYSLSTNSPMTKHHISLVTVFFSVPLISNSLLKYLLSAPSLITFDRLLEYRRLVYLEEQ